MKRILYLTFYFRPDLCAGSFRNSPLVDELAEQIKHKDIQIDVITTSPNRYSSYRKEFEEKETLGDVFIERIVVPSHESGIKDQILSFKTYFFETLRRTKNRKYDLVFASSSRFFTSYLGYLIAKQNRSPLYLDIRDLFSETIKSVSGNPFITRLIAPVVSNREQKVYRYATHINLISQGFKHYFRKYTSANFSFYTHGVDPAFREKNNANDTFKKNQLKKIVYAGNIGEGQGLHKIIPAAAKQLQQSYTFRIIGDGGTKQLLTDNIKKTELTNVELVNPVSRKKIIEEYKNADILFIHLNDLPVFDKVLPSKIFELAAVEKPILAGVSGYARQFLKENVEGVFLFEPGDVQGFIKQIGDIEKFRAKNKVIDNGSFSKKFDRKKIKKKMAESILSYLK